MYQVRTTLTEEEQILEDYYLAQIQSVRREQDAAHGINWSLNDYAFQALLTESVGRVAGAINGKDLVALKRELVQVAAICVRWLVAITLKTTPNLRKLT